MCFVFLSISYHELFKAQSRGVGRLLSVLLQSQLFVVIPNQMKDENNTKNTVDMFYTKLSFKLNYTVGFFPPFFTYFLDACTIFVVIFI